MSKLKRAKGFLILLVIILGVTIFQDYLQSRYQSYSFYFSESLLFNLFWALILPVTFLLRYTFRKAKIILRINSKWAIRSLFVLVATILHLLLFAFLVYSVSSLFYNHTFGFWGNLVYSVSNDLYKYLLIYTAVSLIPLERPTDTKLQESREYPDFLLLQTGKKTEKVSIESILYITSATPYVEFITEERKYLQQGSLKSFLEKLDPSVFVRIHKTTLVNVSKVDSISSRGNGDYDLFLSNGQELRLSRNYVQDFRSKFDHAHSG
ncbi:LytR/AlgR family response regulator transcription factor [Algoriphagus sp.]|uniref:LytR/AlgR family response regulator transcription factor n=1 Tax=Algoriphagus sp. TaxID=1872435 RepID=UPI00391BDAE2